MWIGQVVDWINANSGFLQALFTLGLVVVTIGLFIATNRYRKATEGLLQATDRYRIATERYADIAENSLILEGMRFLESLYLAVYSGSALEIARKEAITGKRREEQLTKEEQEEFIDQWKQCYRGLVNQMREELAERFSSGSSRKSAKYFINKVLWVLEMLDIGIVVQ